MGRACPLCPGDSDINLFGDRERVVNLDPEISDRAFDLGVAEQELDGSQIPRAAVDQRCLGPPQGVRAENPRVKPDACHPLGKKTSILAGCHRPIAPAAPSEQILAWPLAGFLQEVVNGLPGLIRQLELDRSPGLPLPDGRTIDSIAIRSDIFDPQGDDVATTQLAVDRKVEKGKVAGPSFDQEPGSDRPDLVWPQRRFGSDQLALVPGARRALVKGLSSSGMIVLLGL
jgi:hypothetical protein